MALAGMPVPESAPEPVPNPKPDPKPGPTPVPNPHPPQRSRTRWHNRRWVRIAGWVVLAGVMIGIWFLGQNWPFRYRIIKPELEEVFGSQVFIAHYHRTYFPNPGFIATGITLRRKSAPDQPPIGTVQTLFVQSRWIDLLLLRRHLELVDMTAVHMVLPPPGSRAAQEDFPPGSTSDFTGPDTPIARLEIHDSVLDILRENGSRFSFPVYQLHIENMEKGRAMKFAVAMENAIPHGHIRASGNFGPLSAKSPGDTPVSGDFTFDKINLSDVGKIHGVMASSGRFNGKLAAIHATADTQTPDFAVDDGHPTPVSGSIDCTVNGLTGDVVYHSMRVTTGKTAVQATGSTVGHNGKATNLDIKVDGGRAQDILRPFLHRDVPITGPVSLHAHTYLAPSREGDFFHRLHVDGAFDVPKEVLTDRQTERSLSAFSQRAQGGKAPDTGKDKTTPVPLAISSVAGPAVIRDAVVNTHGLTFSVPGARAWLDGTFNFHTSAVHLTGKVATQADIAHDATGWKSILMKPLAPFFRKKNAGAVIPIAVTGKPGSYKVTQNFTHTK